MSGMNSADLLGPRIRNPTVSEYSSRCGTCSGVTVVYEKDGCCGIAHGLQNELMQQPLIDTTKQMWMGGKCQEEKQKT